MAIRNTALLLAFSILLGACASAEKTSVDPSVNAQEQFFSSLKQLCNARFEGQMTYPKEGQDSFAGKLLIANFANCSDTEIRIPFVVGEDKSRTWIISKTDRGLQLKHDHRHADGTPDEVNMYGGLAKDAGSPLSQSFAADEHTAKIIPAAATNVWTLSLSDDKTALSYYLERNAAPRFKAELQKVDR